jgi:formylglycine-generating enzyme required for sulfatase activity
MVRIAGGPALLGGEDTPLLGLLRRHLDSVRNVDQALLPPAQPERQVPAFRIDRCEVSDADYRRFLEAVRRSGDDAFRHPAQDAGKDHTPKFWSNPRFSAEAQPVVGVDWFDAYAYARWAGKRLPRADEWEAAARGDSCRLYPWGDEFRPELCVSGEGPVNAPVPVGTTASDLSAAGVCDLGGNVSEWVDADLGGRPAKLILGGDWATDCRLYALTYVRARGAVPTHRSEALGFRCAADVR